MQIAAGKFKATCLKLMDEVHDRGTTITVTKRGRRIARLVPVETAERTPLFGYLRGTVQSTGNIVEPIGEAWNADN